MGKFIESLTYGFFYFFLAYGAFSLFIVNTSSVVYFTFVFIKGESAYRKIWVVSIVLEIVYGLINPLLYLCLVPNESIIAFKTYLPALNILLIAAMLVYWTTRLAFKRAEKGGIRAMILQSAIFLGLATVSLFTVQFIVNVVRARRPDSLFLLPYYVIPYFILIIRLRTLRKAVRDPQELQYLF